MPLNRPQTRALSLRSAQRGLSIVEMMVGIAIGLIIVAAATLMVAGQLADNRRLLLETQIQQDLRATADLISRDLRRAGFWRDAHLATGAAAAAGNALGNPYAALELPTAASPLLPTRFAYADVSAPENQTVDNNERRGFRLNNGVIQAELGNGNWQPLTDRDVLNVTGFAVTPRVECVALRCPTGDAACLAMAKRPTAAVSTCTAGDNPCPAYQQIRNVSLTITGTPANDASIERSITTRVRVRNDAVVNACVERL
jgi:prepilin peptidase dependent protein B